jgi:hypothetical protein
VKCARGANLSWVACPCGLVEAIYLSDSSPPPLEQTILATVYVIGTRVCLQT